MPTLTSTCDPKSVPGFGRGPLFQGLLVPGLALQVAVLPAESVAWTSSVSEGPLMTVERRL